MNYIETLKKLDEVYEHNILFKSNQFFYEFLSWHPNLYNGVDLNKNEIDFINNYFYNYYVEPQTFEGEFIECLRLSLPRFHNLKKIEFKDDISNLVGSKTIRHLISNTIENRSQQSNRNGNQTQNSDINFKNAERELPMQSSGNDFETTINWSNGASGINENKSTSQNTIKSQDIQNLIDSLNNSNDLVETVDHQNELVVEAIDKIYNYLLKPKSIEFLIEKLKPAFILVY